MSENDNYIVRGGGVDPEPDPDNDYVSLKRNYDSSDQYVNSIAYTSGLTFPNEVSSAFGFNWTRAGFTITSWNTQRNGSGTSYAVGAAIPSASTFWAIWTATADITISYNNSTILELSNSGTEILDTEDTYLIDDITIEYIKPTANLQTKTNITPTTSSQTITPDSGYDGLSSVQINAMPSGTAGTPSASKGTVSNNSIAVTPSVTNTTGYITGGTKTGTAVTVSASELVSGTKSITASGMTDVTNYASVSVAAGSATAPSTISGTSASVSTGTNTLTLSKTISVTPVVSAGYVSSGTAGNSSVSLTASVTTKSAATYTPTTSNQTIAGGTYLTGAQTILGDTNLVPANIASGVTIFNVTGTHSGGTDVSDTTATASDVLTGKYFYTAGGTKTQGSIPIYTGANTPG